MSLDDLLPLVAGIGASPGVGAVGHAEQQRGDAAALHPGRDSRRELILQDKTAAMQADPPLDDPVTADKLSAIHIEAQVQAGRNPGTAGWRITPLMIPRLVESRNACSSAARRAQYVDPTGW